MTLRSNCYKLSTPCADLDIVAIFEDELNDIPTVFRILAQKTTTLSDLQVIESVEHKSLLFQLYSGYMNFLHQINVGSITKKQFISILTSV